MSFLWWWVWVGCVVWGGGVPSFVIATSGVVVVGLGGPPSLGGVAGSHSPLRGVHSKSSTIVISVGIRAVSRLLLYAYFYWMAVAAGLNPDLAAVSISSRLS